MITVLVQSPPRPYFNFPCVASHQFISTRKVNITYILILVNLFNFSKTIYKTILLLLWSGTPRQIKRIVVLVSLHGD